MKCKHKDCEENWASDDQWAFDEDGYCIRCNVGESRYVYQIGSDAVIMHGGCVGTEWYKRSDHAIQDGIKKNYKGIYECTECHKMIITDHMERDEPRRIKDG